MIFQGTARAMSHFDEKCAMPVCETRWGKWWQTVDDVQIEIHNDDKLSAKLIQCKITNSSLSCAVNGVTVIQGKLCRVVQADESTWTLEDGRIVRILLVKSCPGADNLWPSLLSRGMNDEELLVEDAYVVDPYTLDQMQQKLTLNRFQLENPGMDFSGAEISGNYHKGGPKMVP